MKALSLIGLVFAAFLIFLGISSRQASGAVLGNAIVIGGILIAVFVFVVWIILYVKEKREKEK
ncbi:MAG: hypothetical protein JSS81_01880 [Acidobacteria bacterium]|nr:hypothetical protein [Acidobacteriota bacterium]